MTKNKIDPIIKFAPKKKVFIIDVMNTPLEKIKEAIEKWNNSQKDKINLP